MADKPLNFEVGDRVSWSSQAGGCTTVKTGVVVARVPVRARPYVDLNEIVSIYNAEPIDPRSYGRDHESYLVAVEAQRRPKNPFGKTIGHHPPARKMLYWPRANKLVPVPRDAKE